MGHVTGTRSISGTVTCYLDEATGGSADLFQDLIENTDLDENVFSLTATLGGATAPNCAIALPRCNLGVPTHSIDDIINIFGTIHIGSRILLWWLIILLHKIRHTTSHRWL